MPLSGPGHLVERPASFLGVGLRYCVAMDPARKRRVRLVASLGVAVLLLTALIYKSFTASSETVSPSQLLSNAQSGQSYQLTGKVVDGSIHKAGDVTSFKVRDRTGRASVPVRYGSGVPDTFKDGREIILTVRKQGVDFVGQRDSLVTKCPSKFTDTTPSTAPSSSAQPS
jgi:cytochrome c-type biogenesis protein CcmE